MDTLLQSKLIDCFDALERGESVGQILARFPEDAENLRPMLDTAERLSQFAPQPSLAAQKTSRQTFLAQAAALATAPPRRSPLLRMRAVLLPLASMAIVLLFSAGLVAASSSAVPGAPLYGAKRFVEKVQLWLVTDPGGEEGLNDLFSLERIREIQLLLDSGATADVEFEGLVQQIGPEEWIIAGVTTTLNGETKINGVPEEGATVHVLGRVTGGTLVASTISILSNPSPQPATPDAATRNNNADPTATADPSEDRDGHRSTPDATPQVESRPTGPVATPTPLPAQPPVAPSPTPSSSDDSGDLNQNEDGGDGLNPPGDGGNDNDDRSGDDNDNDDHRDDNNNGDDNDNDNDNDDDEEDEEDEENENRRGGG